MAGNTFNTGKYVNAIFQDSSNNIGIGAAPSGTYKFEVTGTAKISGITTFGSTLSNGTYAYTLPSATGTLALTSQIPTNPVGGTGTTNYLPKFTASSTIGNSLIQDNGSSIGISVTPFANTLSTGNIDLANGAGLFGYSNQTYLSNNLYYNGNFTYKATAGASLYNQDNTGAHLWYTVASGTINTTATLSEKMRITQGGNLLLGIGTDSGYKLDVNGTGRFTVGTNQTIEFNVPGGNTGIIYNLGATGNYSRFQLYNSPNATSASRYFALEWDDNSGGLRIAKSGAATFSSSVTAGAGSFTASSGWGLQGYSSNSASINAANGSGYGLYINSGTSASSSTYTAQFVGNGSTQFYIRGDGNVGIGTSSPSVLLSVGASQTSPSAVVDLTLGLNRYLMWGTSGSGASTVRSWGISNNEAVAGDFVIKSSSTNNNTLDTVQFQIRKEGTTLLNYSAGNTLIGTTTDSGEKLQVNGSGIFSGKLKVETTSANSPQFLVRDTTNTGYGVTSYFQNSAKILYIGFGDQNYASFSDKIIITSAGVTTIVNLAGTGSRAVLADAGGTLSAPVSDISVKQNIKPIGYGLNEIVKMNPVWFDFIDGYKNYGEGRQNGNIAQEMEAIIPEAVFTTPSTGKMGINYDQLHAVYIKAIQELKEEINQLKQLINK